MPVIVIAEKCRDFFENKETRIATVVPGLPVIQKAMQLSFFVTKEQDDWVGQVAQNHADSIEQKKGNPYHTHHP
jgi:hypothetical protein